MNKKRIFIGYTDIAGVGSRLEDGFRKMNNKANFYYFKKHPFNYSGGRLLLFSNILFISRIQKSLFVLRMLLRYDYFIYIGLGTSLLKKGLEVRLLNFFNKKTMIIYVGCDVRMPEVVKKYKWNPCSNCSQSYKDYVGCDIAKKKETLKREEILFQYMMSPLECGGYINRSFNNILYPIDCVKLDIKKDKRKKSELIRILHAPSNQEYKGSKYIIEAINKLKHEFDIDFRTIQNVTVNELYDEINNSDIVVDQLLVGFYGLFAIESMAMGKPVVCYIRDNAKEFETPIINANPDTIYDVLKELLQKPFNLCKVGLASRKYVEENHSDVAVCQRVMNYFKEKKES